MKQQIENVIAAARTVASDATPRCVAELCGRVARGAVDTAHRIRQRLAAVWAHAIASGHADVNQAAGLERAMQTVVRQRHRPAMLDLDAARAMLIRAEANQQDDPEHVSGLTADNLRALAAAVS